MGAKDEPPTRVRDSKRPPALASEDVSGPSAKVTGRAARVSRKKSKSGRKQRRLYPDSIPPGMVAEVFDVSSTDEASMTTKVDKRLAPSGLPRPWSKPPAPHPPRPSVRPVEQAAELELDYDDLEPDLGLPNDPAAPILTPPPMVTRVVHGRASLAAIVAWLLVGAAALALGLTLGTRRGDPVRGASAAVAPRALAATPRAPDAKPRAASSDAILIALPEPSPGVLPSEPPPELVSEAPSASASSATAFAPSMAPSDAELPRAAATETSPTAASARAPAPAAEPAPPFDAEAASAAIRAAFTRASGCRGPSDPTGEVTVTLTYAPSGRVTTATVGGIFAGTAVGGCIAATLRSARVPAFSGAHLTVKRTALLR